MYKFTKWIFLIVLGICTFSLGLIRQEYIINIVDNSSPFLLNRNIFLNNEYPFSFNLLFNHLFSDPRWSSSIIYLFYPATSTLLAIYLLFNQKKYMQITLLFYAIGIVILTSTISLSIIFDNYDLGYGLAQHIKKIYQEPYISLLLLGGFYWDQQSSVKKESEERSRKL